MRMKLLSSLYIFLFAQLLQACQPAISVEATPPVPSDDQVNAIARQMYCPICENVPLDVCDTAACADWRDLIRQKLAEGWSKEQIEAYFAQQYGDRVLAEPPAQGLNWLVYILPPLAFLAAGFFLFYLLKKMKPARQQESALPVLDERHVQRLEEELKKREK